MFCHEGSGTPNHAMAKWILAYLRKLRIFSVGVVLTCCCATVFARAILNTSDTSVSTFIGNRFVECISLNGGALTPSSFWCGAWC
jgi:hypothetical protein